MPFASIQEAFEQVLAKAQAGEPFCQYTVGNSYFWWDFLRIQGKSRDDFPSMDAFRSYLRENISRCEDWFWKAFRGGVFWGGNNLIHYYENGDEDLIAPQPEKLKTSTAWERSTAIPTICIGMARTSRRPSDTMRHIAA